MKPGIREMKGEKIRKKREGLREQIEEGLKSGEITKSTTARIPALHTTCTI